VSCGGVGLDDVDDNLIDVGCAVSVFWENGFVDVKVVCELEVEL